MNVECTFCGTLHFSAGRKKSSSYIYPKFSGCCSNGLITSRIVRRFPKTPEILKQLLSQSTPKSEVISPEYSEVQQLLGYGFGYIQLDYS